MYRDIALGRTVHIVATEYLMHDSTLRIIARCWNFIQFHQYVASCRSGLADGNLFCFRSSARISDVIYATLTATKHATEVVILISIFRIYDLRTYSTTVDIHRRILSHSTYLTTAIDTALHSTASHV